MQFLREGDRGKEGSNSCGYIDRRTIEAPVVGAVIVCAKRTPRGR